MDEPKRICERHGIERVRKPRSDSNSYRWQCAECEKGYQRRYSRTAKGKARNRRASQSEKGKASQRRHSQTEKGKATRRRYDQTEKGKANRRRCDRRKHEKNPNQRKAGDAVRSAIRSGKLIRPDTCKCGNSPVQSHHWSYAREHWLDVFWLCDPCHRTLHKQKGRSRDRPRG